MIYQKIHASLQKWAKATPHGWNQKWHGQFCVQNLETRPDQPVKIAREYYDKMLEKKFFWTARQPFRLSHIHVFCVNFSRFSWARSHNFFKIENGKNYIFLNYFFSNLCKFYFIPIKIRQKLLGSMDLTQFLCLSWFQAKKRASQTILNISLGKIGSLRPKRKVIRHGRSVRKLPVIPLGIRNTKVVEGLGTK